MPLPADEKSSLLQDLPGPLPARAAVARLSRFHAICSQAPAFRWGAGVAVTGPRDLVVAAGERNVKNRNTRIALDLFHT